MKPIIESMLDDDLYKFTMQQCVFHQYPNATAEYAFKCRNKDVKLGFLAPYIKEEVEAMRDVFLMEHEAQYLSKLSFIKPDYIRYLNDYVYDSSQVHIFNEEGELIINISGLWRETILWEVKLLSIVNELYFRTKFTDDFRTKFTDECGVKYQGNTRLQKKIEIMSDFPRFQFADFGTRRRFSREWQGDVNAILKRNCPQFIGTSNVKLAMDNGVKAIGTQAHEFISAHLSLVDNIREAQKRAFYVWLQEYGTDLGIALSDTFTTKAFFEDFDYTLANNFQGVRQDSGEAIKFGKEMIEYYKKLGIDPRTKTIVFSDGLDVPTAIKIYKEFTGLIGVSFGIGTNISNDVGLDPLNIVIKLVKCNGKPVVKISDNITKAIGAGEMVKKVMRAYNL